MNAAAISFCPFTPCSLKIATFGLFLRKLSIFRPFLGCLKESFANNPVFEVFEIRSNSDFASSLLSRIDLMRYET